MAIDFEQYVGKMVRIHYESKSRNVFSNINTTWRVTVIARLVAVYADKITYDGSSSCLTLSTRDTLNSGDTHRLFTFTEYRFNDSVIAYSVEAPIELPISTVQSIQEVKATTEFFTFGFLDSLFTTGTLSPTEDTGCKCTMKNLLMRGCKCGGK